jgi:predicted TPR repeat methyltransferase
MTQTADLLREAREHLLVADLGRAETVLRRVIAQDPGEGRAYEMLGKLLYRESRSEEAASIYREWLRAVPDDPVATHLVSATSGESHPPRASNGFIASVFGRAAPEFDAGLAKLGYQAPRLIFEHAMSALDPTRVGLNILDLGCGTGLCAEWFRPLARRIVGVDLAPEMLEQARTRGCYDELICEEITTYAARCTERFDLITAADVFCYFGDLSTGMAAIAPLLSPEGRFVFSVEELPTDTGGYVLLEHGRYAHSASYLSQALAQAGLVSGVPRRAVLRSERGAPVHGLVSSARRQAV